MKLSPTLKSRVISILVFGDPLRNLPTSQWPIDSPAANLKLRLGGSNQDVAGFCNASDMFCAPPGVLPPHLAYPMGGRSTGGSGTPPLPGGGMTTPGDNATPPGGDKTSPGGMARGSLGGFERHKTSGTTGGESTGEDKDTTEKGEGSAGGEGTGEGEGTSAEGGNNSNIDGESSVGEGDTTGEGGKTLGGEDAVGEALLEKGMDCADQRRRWLYWRNRTFLGGIREAGGGGGPSPSGPAVPSGISAAE
ncbi:hypothetical protein RSOLAG22IIIB_07190 [Rhizoctonia solani]|uniref:Cutinase n=1 Tax=Rhizoctonia solani TaxID=456999 RepID=A0A0K6FLV6_9AGAM|nr:hypothetical protein RSOLAG22IIIB_07190 [Rhizoctonia solani]